MNTSDQNVFTLDTAFKRRWEFIKLKNTFEKYEDALGYNHEHHYRSLKVPGPRYKYTTWEQFVTTINEAIIGLDGERNGVINVSDKQIGVYFIDEDGLCENTFDISNPGDKKKMDKFVYKVFSYLWDDVAKFDKDRLFRQGIKTFDELINEYISEKEIFTSDIESKLMPNVD